MRRAALARLLGGLLGWSASPSLAADAGAAAPVDLPLSLEWSAPPGCPTAAEVRSELARLIRAREGGEPVLRARAIITREDGEYVLSLTTLQDGERREKQGRAPDCATLQHMATLILGLALGESAELAAPDSQRVDPRRGTSSEPELSAPEEAEPKPVPAELEPAELEPAELEPAELEDRAPSSAAEATRLRWVAFGGMASSFGLLPEAAVGPVLGAGFVPRPRVLPSASLSVAMLWPVATTDVRPGITAHFSAVAARAAGCWSSSGSRPEIAACPLALSAGALLAASDGALRDERVVAPWYAWSPSVRIGFGFSQRSRIRLEPTAVFSPFPTEFRVEGVGQVHEVPFWSASVELGLELEVAGIDDE